MRIEPIQQTFGITTSRKITKYAYNSYIEKSKGTYKGHDLYIQKNYLNGRLASTMICLSKAGEWVKSKLKYIENGERKVLRTSSGEVKK